MKMSLMVGAVAICAGVVVVSGCFTGKSCGVCETGGVRTAALDAAAWESSEWLSAAEAPVVTTELKWRWRAASGTSCFKGEVVNEGEVKSATWMTTGLGVYEIYVNGTRVGTDALKPGFTHTRKTRRSFTYDVTDLLKGAKGAKNVFAAQVSSGWWRDRIAGYRGVKSAFRGVLQVVYTDGTTKLYGTSPETWTAGVAGKVKHAGIFDGEEYDAREACPVTEDVALKPAVVNTEFTNFKGVILPSEGGEVCHRFDLTMKPVDAYCWKGVTNAVGKSVYGTVVKTRTFAAGEPLVVTPGETLVLDFGQNCSAVPRFKMTAKRGTILTCLSGEMLNERNGERSRGYDGPAGSVYRANLRIPADGMRLVYTFAGDESESYMPLFTYFGYRCLSITATDTVTFSYVESVPVSSITREMELGRIKTGDASVNKLISNIYWGQLSNYLSVPTDCPQRNERYGWMADTQVFAEAGAFNANTTTFFHKWMRDVVDSSRADGGFTCIAPTDMMFGSETFELGWADAGVIVPWTVWKQFGDTKIIADNWDAMATFVRKLDETKYDFEGKLGYMFADWMTFEKFGTTSNKYGNWKKWKTDPDAMNFRRFLAACYWLGDAKMLSEMAGALGKKAEQEEFRASAKRARDHIRANYLEKDGLLLKPMRDMQTSSIFALKFGIVEGKAYDETKAILLKNIKDHGDCLQTGFLGTSLIMDTLTEIGSADVAYTLLLQRKNPSWLYAVDQGATTIWERWNSYSKDTGFYPKGTSSLNHYAYGAVLAWIYKTAAGIASTSDDPGFKTIIMAPKPDKRIGSVSAEYKAPTGLIKSAWRYEGDKWIWDFTVPTGSTAKVTLPGSTKTKIYKPGTYHIEQ